MEVRRERDGKKNDISWEGIEINRKESRSRELLTYETQLAQG